MSFIYVTILQENMTGLKPQQALVGRLVLMYKIVVPSSCLSMKWCEMTCSILSAIPYFDWNYFTQFQININYKQNAGKWYECQVS